VRVLGKLARGLAVSKIKSRIQSKNPEQEQEQGAREETEQQQQQSRAEQGAQSRAEPRLGGLMRTACSACKLASWFK